MLLSSAAGAMEISNPINVKQNTKKNSDDATNKDIKEMYLVNWLRGECG